MLKNTKENFSKWLGPEQWLARIALAAAGAIALSVSGVLAGWRDQLSVLLLPKLQPQLLLDTIWLLILGLILVVLSWWFYSQSASFKSSGFMGNTPRRFRKCVLSLLRDIVLSEEDGSKAQRMTSLDEQMFTYALGELRSYGWIEIQLTEWGDPSVSYRATAAGRKIAFETLELRTNK